MYILLVELQTKSEKSWLLTSIASIQTGHDWKQADKLLCGLKNHLNIQRHLQPLSEMFFSGVSNCPWMKVITTSLFPIVKHFCCVNKQFTHGILYNMAVRYVICPSMVPRSKAFYSYKGMKLHPIKVIWNKLNKGTDWWRGLGTASR